MAYPKVHIVDETMRDGIQIESATITTESKIALINELSSTGLRELVIGYFARSKYSPSMADVDAVIEGIEPVPGVTYTAGAPNRIGRERMARHVPPLTLMEGVRGLPTLNLRMSDTFHRRNNNEPQSAQIERWEKIARVAADSGKTDAAISLGAAWGCNYEGGYSDDQRSLMLRRMHSVWHAAGLRVTAISFADPMSWGMPHVMSRYLKLVQEEWPDITTYCFHIHNARGTGLAQAYALLEALDERHETYIDASCGGIGGCPYCGNGRVAGMVPTEDLVVMLESMGIATGVDLPKLVRFCWQLEAVIGKRLFGHVSQAGWLPRSESELYDPNLPFVETDEQARHFLLGESVAGSVRPWPIPIPSRSVRVSQ